MNRFITEPLKKVLIGGFPDSDPNNRYRPGWFSPSHRFYFFYREENNCWLVCEAQSHYRITWLWTFEQALEATRQLEQAPWQWWEGATPANPHPPTFWEERNALYAQIERQRRPQP